ncbi:MAG: DUF5723 family protein [Gemmatimonadota bacterium]
MTTRSPIVTLVLSLLMTATAAHAQLPSASSNALGMAENFTAAARGYHAIAWNPALLGLPGGPGTSLAVAPLRLVTGLDPVTLSDLKEYEGIVVPLTVRDRWLAAVRNEGAEAGTGGADVTYIAAQIGSVGIQVSSRLRAIAELSPGAVQLLLFGNADAGGNPQTIDLSGAQLNTFATSTVAASYAIPLRSQTGSMAFGATLKYTVGHLLVFGREQNSEISSEPLTFALEFPLVGTINEEGTNLNNGTGLGIDVGFAMQRERLTLSLTVQNVFNSFKWNTDNLVFRPGIFRFDADSAATNLEEQAFTAAPPSLRELVDDMRYRPTVAAGGALQVSDKLMVTADARSRLGSGGIAESLDDGPDFQVGAGAEYRVLPFLPLRAGAALINGGFQLGAGVGIALGPINLSGSVLRRNGELGSDIVTMVTLVSAGR